MLQNRLGGLNTQIQGKLLLDKDLNHLCIANTLGTNFLYHLCSQRTLARELCYEITYKCVGGGNTEAAWAASWSPQEDGSLQAQWQIYPKKDHLHEGFALWSGWHLHGVPKCLFTSRSLKKCSSSLSPSVVNADLVCGGNSLKTPKQNCSPPRIRAPTPRRLRSRIVIGLFFSCWALFLCLSSSSFDSQSNLKDQKETKTWSLSSSVPAKTVLADRLSTDGHQPLIQLLDCLDLISQPCSQIRCPDPESLHLTTLLLLGWVAPRDTDLSLHLHGSWHSAEKHRRKCICPSGESSLYKQSKIFWSDLAIKGICLYLKQVAFVHTGLSWFAHAACFFNYSLSFLRALAQRPETKLLICIWN